MRPITKIIMGLIGTTAIGILTYYVVIKRNGNDKGKEKNKAIIEKPITNPEKDTVARALVIKDTILDRVKKALSIDGEEFALTEVEGVYTNSTKDKMLVIKENIWKKMLRKIQKKFPDIAEDCNEKDELPELSKYRFVGLLTYLAVNAKDKTTHAYTAREIRNGNSKYFAGGYICCDCEGEPLVPQQVDAVIFK